MFYQQVTNYKLECLASDANSQFKRVLAVSRGIKAFSITSTSEREDGASNR